LWLQVPTVDKEICIGCGNCESVCPEMFRLNQEQKSEVIKESGDCDIQFVIDSCPVGAISMTEK
jgi:ferredoxin